MSQGSAVDDHGADEEFALPTVTPRRGNHGRRCFGYTVDGKQVVEAEAELIREAARRILDGEALRSVVVEFNERGILTTWHGKWYPISLRRVLLNPRMVGLRTYQGKVIGRGDWPPVLDKATFDALGELLQDPSRGTHPPGTKPRRALLSGGLLICGGPVERDGKPTTCGMPLQSQPSNNGKPGYACKPGLGGACGKIRVAAEPLEAEVAAQALARLASPRIRARIEAAAYTMAGAEAHAGTQGLNDRIAEITDSMAELSADYYVNKVIGRAEFRSTRARLDEQLTQARAARDQLARLHDMPDLTPAGLTQWWEDHERDPVERRALLTTVLDHIVVGPSTKRGFTGLDEGRLTWIWR